MHILFCSKPSGLMGLGYAFYNIFNIDPYFPRVSANHSINQKKLDTQLLCSNGVKTLNLHRCCNPVQNKTCNPYRLVKRFNFL